MADDNDNNHMVFGQWLREQRRALDLTQEDLAIRINVGWELIRKIESGARHPSREVAEQLADVFRVPSDRRSAFVQFARSGVDAEHFLLLPEVERDDG